ncbi:MAG TPA: DUF6064 family protein [Casimicrobiaceae bacterium]|nr:DUF6064 family protein [Casimicrobiaceae bacterium]
MSEWWTYRIASFVLFSPRTYLRLCEHYNATVWPLQIVTLAAGVALVLVARNAGSSPSRAVPLTMAALWLFVAYAFHLRRYAAINWAADYFAIAFIAQAVLLGWSGATGALRFGTNTSWQHSAGLAIFAFALAGVPLLERLSGRSWRELEAFGTFPDPTALGTLGILLVAREPPWVLLGIPLAWCVINGAFQWTVGFTDALALPLIALTALSLRVASALRQALRPSGR